MTRFRAFWANEKRRKDLLAALGFLTPNITGFLCFVTLPVLFSFGMAFTNWNLTQVEPFRFTGLENFRELLFEDAKFWQYFINTLYLMLGIPIGIAGSLFLATLLSKPVQVGSRRVHWVIALTALGLSAIGAVFLFIAGRPDSAFLVMLLGVVTFGGVILQVVFFRTLFYLPYFTSGVAMFILWKNLLHPDWGLINKGIGLVYGGLQGVARAVPSGVMRGVAGLIWAVAIVLLILLLRRVIGGFISKGYLLPGSVASFVGLAALAGIGWLIWRWPNLAEAPFEPVRWLTSVRNLFGINPEKAQLSRTYWGLGARDAIILMGIWAGIGGNNMLLYLAGLSNIPQDLYESAQIDGAGRWAQFRHVTWPQLAPTTFFIVIMSTIGGLQGGFAQAFIMTRGGPAGTTTTLGYYIYTIGFQEFRLGYASTVAWVMFVMIFCMTLINWRFGSKMVNE